MNEISIDGEYSSENIRHQFNLYSISSFPFLKYYMDSRRSEWEEDK